MSVTLEDPDRMNLLGLMLGNVIARNLARGAGRKLRGHVVVRAGEMVVTIKLAGDQVAIARGAVDPIRAEVSGSMEALLALALGGGMIGPWLAGRLRTRGSLLLLLGLRPLLQVD